MLSLLDYGIVFLFFCGLTIFGLYQGRYNQTAEDYFLAGRSIPWPITMFSIVATETSVLTFISIPGLAYKSNWLFLQLALGYIVGRILVSVVLLPTYFSDGVVSIYETLGRKFGPKVQKIASFVFFLTRVLADGVRFLATGVIVQVVTGWSLPASVLSIGLITLIYASLGGIRAVVWVDGFQFILYLVGGLISIYYLFSFIDMPVIQVYELLIFAEKLQFFQIRGSIFSEPFLFINALIGGIFLSFASHGADYMMVQRVISTKDLSSAKKAMIGSGFFILFQFAIFLTIGSLMFIYFNGFEIEKDREFPTFIVNHLPIGVKGILIAGVLSAAMSTISSSINSLASSVVNDWLGGAVSLKKSKLISLGWGLILITIALFFDESNTSIVLIGLQVASFTYGGLLGLFLLSKLEQNLNTISLIAGLLSSLLIVFYLKQIGLAWTWFIFISVLFNILITLSCERLINLKKVLK